MVATAEVPSREPFLLRVSLLKTSFTLETPHSFVSGLFN